MIFIYSKFSEEAQKVLQQMKWEMQELKHPYVGTEHLLLSILHNYDLDVTKELTKYGLNYDRYRNEIIDVIGLGTKSNDIFLYTALLKRVIENSTYNFKDDEKYVDVIDLFLSLLDEGEGVANRILLGMNIDIDFLYEIFSKKRFSRDKKHLYLIEEYGYCLNDRYHSNGFDPVIGREEQVNRLIEILLRKTKNNPVLVGDAGVGKTAIVEELVRRIECKDVPQKLLDVKVISLSISSLIAGTKYRGEFEERINQIINEIEGKKDVVVFIDEIHTLVGAGGAEGAIDASNILKPYLARGTIRVIGATTSDEYSKYIEVDKALDRRFQMINVFEMTKDETKNILFKLRNIYQDYHNVVVSDEIIDNIVNLVDRYIYLGKFPDKAIDVFDEVCAKTSISNNKSVSIFKGLNDRLEFVNLKKKELLSKQKFKEAGLYRVEQRNLETEIDKFNVSNDYNDKNEVTMSALYNVIYDRTHIPLNIIEKYDSEYFYQQIKNIVFGQDSIIKDLSIYISGYFKNNSCHPLTCLFVGKSGVGKTFLAQEASKLLVDSNSFVKLDMNEYVDDSSISKIIGSPPGYVGFRESRTLTDKIKRNPYSIILLDNIDKCSMKVLGLFKKIFEDGILSNSLGEEVSFKNTIIFMTTNYGCSSRKIGFSSEMGNNYLSKLFDESFLGLIGKIYNFNELDRDIINKIILSKVKREISTNVVDKIIGLSEYTKYGASKINNIINTIDIDLVEV